MVVEAGKVGATAGGGRPERKGAAVAVMEAAMSAWDSRFQGCMGLQR